MSLNSAAVELTNALKTAGLVWDYTLQRWKDPVSRDFEANVWAPLEGHTRAAIQAMERLTPVLMKALHDCA